MTAYELSLYDTEGVFVRRVPCVPPFDPAPDIAIDGTRYYILMDDGTYTEAKGVHWVDQTVDPGPQKSVG